MERNCLGHHLHIARAAASDGVLRFERDSLPRDMGRTAHRRQPTRAPFVRSIAEPFDVYLSRESDKPRHCARSSEGSNRGERLVLLGAIEAVNGLILFGLTTAFLFAAIQQVWLLWRD